MEKLGHIEIFLEILYIFFSRADRHRKVTDH